MPWQHMVGDVALEVDPVTGEWAYSTVIVLVQRQAGKTSLVASTGVHRAITGTDRGVWYTAQRREDARDEFMKLVKRIRRSALRPPLTKVRESNGSETVTFPTGSTYRIFAPVEDALHGKTIHLATVDEGWAFDQARGDALVQAIVPGFTTVPGQLFVVSAAGTGKSRWLAQLRDAGRAVAEAGRRDTVAYFEFGIGDDVDPTDLAAVALAHPGYGFTLRPAALVQAAATMKADEFARAYGGRWTGAAVRVIPALLWAATPDTVTPLPPPGGFALGFDVDLDAEQAVIAAAWRDPPPGPGQLGRAHVEIVDVCPGPALVPHLVDLVALYLPRAVGNDRYGPAADAADAAILAGVDPLAQTGTEAFAAACARFLAHIVAGQLAARPHPALDAAVAVVPRRNIGGGRWCWDRLAAASPVAAVIASTVALWVYDHAPPVAPFRVR